MTQNEISSAVNAVYILRPSPSDWIEEESGDWIEEVYRKQKEQFDQASEEFCIRIRQAEDHNIFDVLFPLACSRFKPSEPLYGMEAFAAHILFYLKPSCPISCMDAIRRVSRSDWNLSLKEVPWYLASFFGTDMVDGIIDELEQEDDVQASLAKLTAWQSANYFQGMNISKWVKMRKAEPQADVYQRLKIILYWFDIFVREQEDIFKTWNPFWQRHRQVAELPAV